MNDISAFTPTLAHRSTANAMLAFVLDKLSPDEPSEAHTAPKEFFRAFSAALGIGLPMSVLAVRIENYPTLAETTSTPATLDAAIAGQLRMIFGRTTLVTRSYEGEFCVLLIGRDQYTDLMPLLEHATSRAYAGDKNGDGLRLQCNVGIARYPLDTEDLQELVAMARSAAADLEPSTCGFQFVERWHRVRA